MRAGRPNFARWIAPAVLLAGAILAGACSSAAPARDGSGGGTEDGGPDGDAGAPPDDPTFATVWSGTALAVPANQLMVSGGAFVNTYRTYVRPRDSGSWQWRFWVGNATDSTYGPGPLDPDQPGGTWRIETATVADGGPTATGGILPGTALPVTFSGSASRQVEPGERFWSDPVTLDLPAGHLLAFTWAVSAAAAGPVLTYASASFAPSWAAPGANLASQESATGFSEGIDRLVAPHLFAYDRPVTERLCFVGDSITQGVGSTRDAYGFWVAKIADGLGPDVGIWNLGSGYARAADAAADGIWLYKAKQCTEVAVVLGVNDISNEKPTAAQLLDYLTTIVTLLKQHAPATKVILFTVPTFNFTGTAYTTWKQVNDAIRGGPPAGVDRVFDIAAVLSQPAPNDGLVKPEYSTNGDAHPNDLGSTDIAAAFLAWYRP